MNKRQREATARAASLCWRNKIYESWTAFDFGNSIQISIKVLTYPEGYAIILTESTDDGCPHQSWLLRNNRLMWESGGYFFYLSRRLLKYSARAISKDNIISNSTNVMYIVTTSLQRNWREKKNLSLPSVRWEATATVNGALRVLKIPRILYHNRHIKSRLNKYFILNWRQAYCNSHFYIQ